MFVGVQVDIEGEGWMVRVVDKCYYCIYERDNLLDVIITTTENYSKMELLLASLFSLRLLFCAERWDKRNCV